MGEADSAHHYHNLVVKDILDSERTYVQDIHVSSQSMYSFMLSCIYSLECNTNDTPFKNKYAVLLRGSLFYFRELCGRIVVLTLVAYTHTHTHAHTHTCTHTYTHIRTFSPSLCVCLLLKHSHSLSLAHAHSALPCINGLGVYSS